MNRQTARANAELLQIGNQGVALCFPGNEKVSWHGCILISTGTDAGPSIRALVCYPDGRTTYETNGHRTLEKCLDELRFDHIADCFPLPELSSDARQLADVIIGAAAPRVLRSMVQALLRSSDLAVGAHPSRTDGDGW